MSQTTTEPKAPQVVGTCPGCGAFVATTEEGRVHRHLSGPVACIGSMLPSEEQSNPRLDVYLMRRRCENDERRANKLSPRWSDLCRGPFMVYGREELRDRWGGLVRRATRWAMPATSITVAERLARTLRAEAQDIGEVEVQTYEGQTVSLRRFVPTLDGSRSYWKVLQAAPAAREVAR